MPWKASARFFSSDTLPDIVLLERSHVCFSLAESPLQIWQKQEGLKGNHGYSHGAPVSWQRASVETILQRPFLLDIADPGNLQKKIILELRSIKKIQTQDTLEFERIQEMAKVLQVFCTEDCCGNAGAVSAAMSCNNGIAGACSWLRDHMFLSSHLFW